MTALGHRFYVVGIDMSIYRKALWNEDVTVFHQTTDIVSNKKVVSWERYIYSNCFWKLQNKQTLGGTQIVLNPVYIVRVPDNQATEFHTVLGDIVVKGNVPEPDANDSEYPTTPTALMKLYGEDCFMVKSITDNTKMKMTAHWLLRDTK